MSKEMTQRLYLLIIEGMSVYLGDVGGQYDKELIDELMNGIHVLRENNKCI